MYFPLNVFKHLPLNVFTPQCVHTLPLNTFTPLSQSQNTHYSWKQERIMPLKQERCARKKRIKLVLDLHPLQARRANVS